MANFTYTAPLHERIIVADLQLIPAVFEMADGNVEGQVIMRDGEIVAWRMQDGAWYASGKEEQKETGKSDNG